MSLMLWVLVLGNLLTLVIMVVLIFLLDLSDEDSGEGQP